MEENDDDDVVIFSTEAGRGERARAPQLWRARAFARQTSCPCRHNRGSRRKRGIAHKSKSVVSVCRRFFSSHSLFTLTFYFVFVRCFGLFFISVDFYLCSCRLRALSLWFGLYASMHIKTHFSCFVWFIFFSFLSSVFFFYNNFYFCYHAFIMPLSFRKCTALLFFFCLLRHSLSFNLLLLSLSLSGCRTLSCILLLLLLLVDSRR